MTQPINPYVAGAPLRGERGFFGRQDTLNWVARALRSPTTNVLVLFGQRRIGRTTILLQLERTLPADAFLPVYFDLHDQATRQLDHVLADLADTVAERADLEPPVPTAFDDQGHFFHRVFLPHLYQALGEHRRPVFLLDEFDVLDQAAETELPETAASRTLFPFLRHVMAEDPRPAFVFAIGGRAEDLSLDFVATFKASLVQEIWVLDWQSAEALVRQAEANGTLRFTDKAVSRILTLTSCHPYLTQLLCQRIWEQAYATKPAQPPLVDAPRVEAAVSDVLEAGHQALTWIWFGLTTAERIYAAALAEAADERETISEDQVIQVLTTYAAWLRTREVELASRDLVKRRVLEQVGEREYRFAIELFRRWVHWCKPLHEVRDELDQMETMADRLYETGKEFLGQRQWEIATRHFRDALATNPYHFRARLHLGEALLELGQTDAAVVELGQAYELDQDEARYALVRALLAQAKTREEARDEDGALQACERALRISPNEPSAYQIRFSIWTQRGDRALEHNDFGTALDAYRRAGNLEQAATVEKIMQRALKEFGGKVQTYKYSHLVIEHFPPYEYRVSWYQADQVVLPTETIHSALHYQSDEWRSQTEDVGRAAFRMYLPTRAQEFMRTYRNWAIQISTDWGDIPWELLHDDQEFLCLSRPVARKPKLLKEPMMHTHEQEEPLRALVVGNPTGDLPGAEAEAEAVARMLEDAQVDVDLLLGPKQAAATAFSTRIASRRYNLIHYAGHSYFDPNEPHLSGLEFPEMPVFAEELERGLSSRAFVFLSACESAQTRTEEISIGFRGKFLEGLAISVLLGGAIGCLGPMWKIEDGLAKDFALAFYKYLLAEKEPIAEAVRRARLEVRDRSPDFWASWILYGDPLQLLIA